MSGDADVQFGQIALQNKLISKKQHTEAWKTLKKLRKAYRGKKKKPRLVDVLVQQELISGSQARSVENARIYRQARVQDKLYGRIALKSKFVKPKHVEKGLEKQKQAYLDGDDLLRLSEFLLDKKLLNEDQDAAIQEVLEKLDVQDYMEGRKGSGKGSASEDDDDLDLDLDLDADDDDDLEELDLDADDDDDDLEELDLDLDDDDDEGPTESLDEAEDLDQLDSDIEDALSGIDEAELEADGSSAGIDESLPAPRGLSSDDLLDDLDADEMSGLDLGDGLGKLGAEESEDDLGSDIDLTSDEVATATASGKKAKKPKKAKKAKDKKTKKSPSVSDDLDLDDLGSDIDIDLDDLDEDLDL